MRLLYVVHSLPHINQAGTEIYTQELMREIAKDGHHVFVVTRICDTKRKEYELTKKSVDGITIFTINNTFRDCLSFTMYFDNASIDAIFNKILDEVKPEIIHVQHLIFLSIGFLKIAKNRGIPLIFTLHDYWLFCPKWHLLKKDLSVCDKAYKGKFDTECQDCLRGAFIFSKNAKRLYWMMKSLLPAFLANYLKKTYFRFRISNSGSHQIDRLLRDRRCRLETAISCIDVFLAPSAFLMEKFLFSYGVPEKVKLLRNGIPAPDSINNEINRSNMNIRLAYIGTILPAKGVHILIKAFKGIEGSNLELKIFGDMRQYNGFEYYPSRLKELSVNDGRIKFMQEFNYQRIDEVMRDIDILIVPSIWNENAPLVIQEALIRGIPVVASRIGGIPEVVNDGINGLLFRPGDADDLRSKLRLLIDSPELRMEIVGYRTPVKRIQDHAAEIGDIYKELVADSPVDAGFST
jgi:glycosyltransferase involved in cell wall biosynthesis